MTREEAIKVLNMVEAHGIADEAKRMAIEALSEPMTEEVREALMRLSMCAREDCVICKYTDKCNFDFQYEESTKNMNTILDSLMRSKCEVDAKWIPCSEKLPDIEQDVLATTTLFGVREVTFAWRINDGEWLIREGSSEATNNDILAWMPLPKPYREDGEDYELATEQMEHDAMYEPTYNPEDGSM